MAEFASDTHMPDSPWGTKFRCDICGKTFRLYGAMLTHKARAHGWKPGKKG